MSTLPTPVPARVFGFVAAQADVAVLFRIGPRKRTLMVKWNLATDEFEIGQWLFVRVAGGMLSPDGRLLSYQAHNSKYNYYYNVISRPPYYTALALWEISGPYSPCIAWLKNAPEVPIRRPTKGEVPESQATQLSDQGGYPSPWVRAADGSPQFHRNCPLGELVWYWEPFKPHFYSLDDDLLDAQWLDVDHRGRLLMAREGRIIVRDADGERELIDLNPLEFRPLEAPDWAKRWPDEPSYPPRK